MKLKKIIISIIVFLVLLAGLLLYSRFIGTSGLVVNEYKIESENLPQSFHGMKLVHFSDLHYGSTIDEKDLKEIVNKINYLNPDIVVFTGDLIDSKVKFDSKIKDTLISYLSSINANIEKYAVFGNHDYYNESYTSIMESSGFILLNNNYDIVYNGDYKPIFIGGLGNVSYNKQDINSMMSYFNDVNNDLYKIILVHEPDIVDELLTYNVDVVLSGHSHNGQIVLPFIGAVFTPNLAKNYYAPHYKLNKTDLYISSGLGTSEVNFRLFNKPSINFYRFVKINKKE